MLDFYPIMTKEQFMDVKKQAMTGHMKDKYTPSILSHAAIFNLRRNNLAEAMRQINRAIQINQELNPQISNDLSDSFVILYTKKAHI